MNRPKRYGRVRWTVQEVEILRREWGEIGVRSLRAKLPGRTWCGIRQKAHDLGLEFGIPQGKVSIKEGARRAGLSEDLFLRVIVAAGVLVKRHPFPTQEHSFGARWQVCEWDEAREAVERWAGGVEKVTAAARRHGLTPGCLWCWLRDAGVIKPEGKRAGFRELPSSVIDAVVAKRRTPEDAYRSVREAAEAAGVGVDLLRRRLAKAGHVAGARGSRLIVTKALVCEVLEARRAA